MADPVTAGLVLGGGMAATGAASSIVGYQQDTANAGNQANASEYNASLLDQQAKSVQDVAAGKQMQQQRQARQVISAQRAALLQNGGGLGGAAENAISDSTTAAELDKLNIAYEGELQARGLHQEAEGQRWNAEIARANKKTAAVNLAIGLAGSAMGGASTAYSAGAFGGGRTTANLYAPKYNSGTV